MVYVLDKKKTYKGKREVKGIKKGLKSDGFDKFNCYAKKIIRNYKRKKEPEVVKEKRKKKKNVSSFVSSIKTRRFSNVKPINFKYKSKSKVLDRPVIYNKNSNKTTKNRNMNNKGFCFSARELDIQKIKKKHKTSELDKIDINLLLKIEEVIFGIFIAVQKSNEIYDLFKDYTELIQEFSFENWDSLFKEEEELSEFKVSFILERLSSMVCFYLVITNNYYDQISFLSKIVFLVYSNINSFIFKLTEIFEDSEKINVGLKETQPHNQ